MRTLLEADHRSIGIDIKKSAFTHGVGSITDRNFVKTCMAGVHAVLHTATLHKPHVATHTRQDKCIEKVWAFCVTGIGFGLVRRASCYAAWIDAPA